MCLCDVAIFLPEMRSSLDSLGLHMAYDTDAMVVPRSCGLSVMPRQKAKWYRVPETDLAEDDEMRSTVSPCSVT